MIRIIRATYCGCYDLEIHYTANKPLHSFATKEKDMKFSQFDPEQAKPAHENTILAMPTPSSTMN